MRKVITFLSFFLMVFALQAQTPQSSNNNNQDYPIPIPVQEVETLDTACTVEVIFIEKEPNGAWVLFNNEEYFVIGLQRKALTKGDIVKIKPTFVEGRMVKI